MNNKVRSDSNNSSNSFSKTLRNGLIATSLLFTLWSQPAESKTVEKNMNKIEMTTDKAASPMVENIEQQSTPDYIGQAEAWLKKYYPQYTNYFKNILKILKSEPQNNITIINSIIEDNLETFEDDISSEKETIQIILTSFEYLIWKNQFSKNENWNNKNNNIKDTAAKYISSTILKRIWLSYKEYLITRENAFETFDKIKYKWESWNTTPETMYNDYDEIWNARNELIFTKKLLKTTDIKNMIPLQKEIKNYIKLCNILNKKPSHIWQKFIDEYNKIKE